MPRIKIIDRYLAWEYVKTFLAILGIGVTVLLLNVFFDSFEKITENQPPLSVILLYFAYRLPGETVELVPLMAILGVLFSIGLLSKNNEVLAMHACGVSYTRLSLPVALVGFGLIAILIYSSESVLPGLKQRERFYETVISNKDFLDLYRQVGDAAMTSPEAEKLIGGSQGNVFKPETHGMVYFAEFYDSRTRTMAMPVVFLMDPSGRFPLKRIQATQARLLENRPDADLWQFDNAIVRNFDSKTHAASKAFTFDRLVRPLPKHVDQLLAQRKSAGEMNMRDLASLIGILQQMGENTRLYSYELQHKIAFPLSTVILMLIGYTISVRAHVRPMVVGVAYGLFAGILYYLIDATCGKVGQTGLAAPWLAGWFPNLVFFAGLVYRMRYVNQVRD